MLGKKINPCSVLRDTDTYRYILGIKTYTVRDTNDGHITVNGELIRNYTPEYQIFRSSKYSQPRDVSGFIRTEPPVPTTTCSPEADEKPKDILKGLSRRRDRAVFEHGQDPETGEVNPRLKAIINFPRYKVAVDEYFAHFPEQQPNGNKRRDSGVPTEVDGHAESEN
jgi:hypothetical protein